MKIEKIKNYNQKLLAILGTLAIILVTLSILGVGGMVISEYLRYESYEDTDTGILSDEKIDELQKENKRKQVISYQTPQLIDTLNSIYIIPVSHKNLNEAEDISGILNIKKKPGRNYGSSDSRYYRQYYGAYNNLIIYNEKNDSTSQLFSKRVNFNNIDIKHFSDEILLLFNGAERDTYKDGVINLSDLKSLYIYSLKESKLKKIENEGKDIVSYKFINESKDLIISFGVDKNNDGKYDDLKEPTIIKKYNFKTEKMTNIISENINSQLQKMLEGSVK